MSSTLQALGPGEGQRFLRAAEVIRDVTLRADVGAHLLAGGHGVDVVVLDPCDAFSARMPSMKAGRVIRNCMVLGSWQSMQATGCFAYLRASGYFMWFTNWKPLNMSPLPSWL